MRFEIHICIMCKIGKLADKGGWLTVGIPLFRELIEIGEFNDGDLLKVWVCNICMFTTDNPDEVIVIEA